VDEFELAVEVATPGERAQPQENEHNTMDDTIPEFTAHHGNVDKDEGIVLNRQQKDGRMCAPKEEPLHFGPATPGTGHPAQTPDVKAVGSSRLPNVKSLGSPGLQPPSDMHVSGNVWDEEEEEAGGASGRLLTPVHEDAAQEDGTSPSRTPSHAPSVACSDTSSGKLTRSCGTARIATLSWNFPRWRSRWCIMFIPLGHVKHSTLTTAWQ
jgi:hypothetical protein